MNLSEIAKKSLIATTVAKVTNDLYHFSKRDVDTVLKKVNLRLDERFDRVRSSHLFRDLPQGSNYLNKT